ncbi:unnamed protein product [Pleuronectes platessa]|uniref:Uncharacterized protein n=1 Tax=Pleuronectes platessa TaxID=8262 RepID=A0A9N7USL3_PLEPL|nr:unnamed protein product [Pleuronectes platessa]
MIPCVPAECCRDAPPKRPVATTEHHSPASPLVLWWEEIPVFLSFSSGAAELPGFRERLRCVPSANRLRATLSFNIASAGAGSASPHSRHTVVERFLQFRTVQEAIKGLPSTEVWNEPIKGSAACRAPTVGMKSGHTSQHQELQAHGNTHLQYVEKASLILHGSSPPCLMRADGSSGVRRLPPASGPMPPSERMKDREHEERFWRLEGLDPPGNTG